MHKIVTAILINVHTTFAIPKGSVPKLVYHIWSILLNVGNTMQILFPKILIRIKECVINSKFNLIKLVKWIAKALIESIREHSLSFPQWELAGDSQPRLQLAIIQRLAYRPYRGSVATYAAHKNLSIHQILNCVPFIVVCDIFPKLN